MKNQITHVVHAQFDIIFKILIERFFSMTWNAKDEI